MNELFQQRTFSFGSLMFEVFTIEQKHHDVSFKELEIKKIRRGATVSVHVSLFLSTLKPFCSVLCVLNSQSRAETLQNITRGSNNEVWSSGHLSDDKPFAPADDIRQASLVRLPLCIYDTPLLC